VVMCEYKNGHQKDYVLKNKLTIQGSPVNIIGGTYMTIYCSL